MDTLDETQKEELDQEYQTVLLETKKKVRRKIAVLLLVAVLLLGLLAAAGMLWHTYQNGLQMQLQGESWITQEYGQNFTDPGATASFDGFFYDQQEIPVTVEGTVDTKQLGLHQLTYTSEYKLDLYVCTLTCQSVQTRKVMVVDTQAPEILLTTDPDYYTLPGGTYVEEGFVAMDNHDGDITASVERIQTQDQVIYRVADASGNTTEMTRSITYTDPVAPQLTLKGAQVIMLRLGKTYVEPGFVATDNCDGDITQKVTVTGTVDGNTAGTYVLEYSVQDGSGNTATATRKVIVDYVKQVSGLPAMPDQTPTEPNGKVVYLTFDDGPSYYTSHLLDVLDKYEAKVSFFVVYADNAELLKRMDAAGHTVGMHSNTHDYGYIYSSEEAYFADLYAVQSKIEAAIGYKPMLLRFPGGSANTVSISYCGGIMTTLTQRVKELGFRYFDWNGDSRDVDGAESAKDVYINVTYGMHYTQNCIMLQHDIIGFSVEAVEDIVKWGLLNGYTFAPLTMDSPVCEFRVAN